MNNVKYEIYVGLKDKDTYHEYLSHDDVKEMLCTYCAGEEIAFSLVTLRGGYAHNKGYVTENSLKVELIGASLSDVEKLALEFKKRVNTDTVMITKETIDTRFI